MGWPRKKFFCTIIAMNHINIHTKFQVRSSMYVVAHQLLLWNVSSKNRYLALFWISANFQSYSEPPVARVNLKIPPFFARPENLPGGAERQRGNEGIFRFRRRFWILGGPNSVLRKIYTFFATSETVRLVFRDVLGYKLPMTRPIDGDRKKFFFSTGWVNLTQLTSKIAILALSGLT